MSDRQLSAERTWRAHPFLSAALRFTLFVLPMVASVVVGWIAARAMPHPSSPLSIVAWWAVFLLALTVPAALCVKLGRRVLPMAALLKLTLVFPDRAPSRLQVAKRAGRTRDLKRRLASGEASDDATEAAALVLALITSLGEHDRRTRGHSERVRAFADMLGDQLHLSRDQREKLRWAALLHDIGKLDVGPEILNKPGKPTDEEWAVLRRHPLEGTRLLGPLGTWLGPWAGAVTEHHERWDGTGYPQQLAGENISLSGRILAIADSYEVMTAARAYKRPMTAEAARAELTRCSGTHFDPRLVREFLEISVGRLWLAIGLGALVAQLPVLSGLSYRGLLQRFGRSVATAAGAAGAVTALMVGGAIQPPGSAPGEGPRFIAVTAGETDGDGDEVLGGRVGGDGTRDGRDGPEGGAGEADGAGGGAADSTGSDPGSVPPSDEAPSEPDDRNDPPTNEDDDDVRRVVEEGAVLAAAPLDPTVHGVTETEFLAACATPSSQGTDAYVFEVPKDGRTTVQDVTIQPTAGGGDGSVRAYSDDCDPVARLPLARSSALPPGTAWIVVVPTRGLGATVILELVVRG